MPRSSRFRFPLVLAFAAVAPGCASDEQAPYDFSSAEATLLEFEFDGQLIADSLWDADQSIENQLLYTIGHLNGDRAVGRLDKLELTQVERSDTDDGKTLVRYHAKLPVGWGSKDNLPTSYELTLPLHGDDSDYQSFTGKYAHSCVDAHAHDVDSGSMWYYYRPRASGCQLAEGDVFTTTATVKVSSENTTGKYPEYHKVWQDEVLHVVAIFGKYEDGTTTAADVGISAYNQFVDQLKGRLSSHTLTTVPAEVPGSPGVETPDVSFSATLADGKRVEAVALLVDNVSTASAEFYERYESLSTDADLIFYNGHAGLGQNVRALARRGRFMHGKYQVFFMNGCDTFAYVDGYLAETRAALNPDDPTGTRYMDMVTNVMPSFFHSMPDASMAMIDGLMSYAEPRTYERIFADIDSSEVVVVTGEEDNVYEPDFNPGGSGWAGLEDRGSLARGASKQIDLGELPKGSYAFTTRHDPDAPGGDIDLYVASGRVPTVDDYDQRSYLSGSDESITLKLESPTRVTLLLHAYDDDPAESSAYLFEGRVAQ
jgi:hypothetical protein